MSKFIKNELKSESDSDLHSDDKESMPKFKESDIDFDYNSGSNSEKKSNFGSNINEVIRPVLNFLFIFFNDKISQVQKSIFLINIVLKSI